MLNVDFVKQLKQVNVSADFDKVAERIKSAYKSLSRADKDRLITLSGQERNSIYRAEKTGKITAKVLLPMAYVCNVSPQWLAAESDDKDEFTKELLIAFLEEHGYQKLIAELDDAGSEKKPGRKRGRKSKAELTAEAAKAAEVMGEALDMEAEEETVAEAEVTCAACAHGDDDMSDCDECDECCDEDDVIDIHLKFKNSDAQQEVLDNLDVEETVYLLRAMAIRATYSEDEEQIYEIIKRCLLV